MATLRFDSWPADFDGAYAADTAADAADARVDLAAELPEGEWQALQAAEYPVGTEFGTLLFIDGTRRMEARVHLEDADSTIAHGGLGVIAVGAVLVRPGQPAEFHPDLRIGRWCFIGSGQLHGPVLLEAGDGWSGELEFTPEPVAGTDPEAIMQALQNRMRLEESYLASALAQAEPEALIITDGPLPLHDHGQRLIGYIKTTSLQRLGGRQLEVARNLKAGERTPIYRVGTGSAVHFEWVLRLRDPAPWYYSLAGTVRLQVAASADEDRPGEFVRRVADWSCRELPRFSTQAHQDPRAPQQLLPIRALEAELKRRMGDSQLVRRRIVREYFAR